MSFNKSKNTTPKTQKPQRINSDKRSNRQKGGKSGLNWKVVKLIIGHFGVFAEWLFAFLAI